MACTGCHITHRDLVFIMDDPEKRMTLFHEHLLVKPIFECPSCKRPCVVNARTFRYRCDKLYKFEDGKVKRCGINNSALTGTILRNVKIPLNKLLDLIYFWLRPGMTFERVAHEVRTSKQTLQDWFTTCREVAIMFCCASVGLIGGKGALVELYEAEWEKNPKRGRLGLVPATWAFGGIECGTNKLFLVPVNDISDETLVSIINKWVLPGTTIILNSWTSERTIDLDSYTLKVVFQPPERCGKKRMHNVSYLAEFLFKKAFTSQPERFHKFLIAAATFQNSHSKILLGTAGEI